MHFGWEEGYLKNLFLFKNNTLATVEKKIGLYAPSRCSKEAVVKMSL